MKIAPNWLRTDPLQFVLGELILGGGAAYCVGGCVRDAIMGLPVNDIDIATSRTPKEVENIFKGLSNVRLLPTGVDHGTWTVIVSDPESGDHAFEVTTFRKDVSTDGRRATVEFASDMTEDAKRRDFTMNALYMDWEGRVLDPTGKGIADIMSRTVRFVGNPEERCREDYLRILRLFRFHAKYGKGPIDPDALYAARACASGLLDVSGERKWEELKKLLSMHDPMDALTAMEKNRVLAVLLPRHGQVTNVADVLHIEQFAGLEPEWERRLVALMGYDIEDVVMPFPVSKKEQTRLVTLATYYGRSGIPAHVAYLLKDPNLALSCVVLETAFERGTWFEPYLSIERGMSAKCPVQPLDLLDYDIRPGPEMGELLKKADRAFLASDLLAKKEALLEHIGVKKAA